MPSSDALVPLIIVSGGLVLAPIARLVTRRRLEQRAWGARRSALSSADRREIRHAIRDGRPVGDRALAVPAVRYGEEAESSIARTPSLLSDPPRWLYAAARILFPLLGTTALVLGITGHDTTSVVNGVLLLAFTLLYLPVTERWARTRRTRYRHRLRESLDANRLLSCDP